MFVHHPNSYPNARCSATFGCGFAALCLCVGSTTPAVDLTAKNAKITKKDSYCQEREIHDPEQPLTPALSPSEGEREPPRQLRV